MNGPCILQAKLVQIGHSDTPDCRDKRWPLENLTNVFPINGMPGLHLVGRQIYDGFPSDPVGSSKLRLSKEGATWRTPNGST